MPKPSIPMMWKRSRLLSLPIALSLYGCVSRPVPVPCMAFPPPPPLSLPPAGQLTQDLESLFHPSTSVRVSSPLSSSMKTPLTTADKP